MLSKAISWLKAKIQVLQVNFYPEMSFEKQEKYINVKKKKRQKRKKSGIIH
jgi:hypothetical protein